MAKHRTDFYPTPRYATEVLLDREDFGRSVWECACGKGHISEALIAAGYEVYSSDKVYRGYGHVEDFLTSERLTESIVTNPPYRLAAEFVLKAMVSATYKVAMFLQLGFLSSKGRFDLFSDYPPKVVYVFTNRVSLYPAGERGSLGSGTVNYAWFVWEKDFRGCTRLDRFPPNAELWEEAAGRS